MKTPAQSHRTGFSLSTACLLLGVAALCVAAPQALAQASDVRPPVPEGTPESPTFRTWVLVFLLSAMCIGAALIPSKRGHQD